MNHGNVKEINKSFYVILLIPFLYTLIFYIHYAQISWFFQDDFTFLKRYDSDIRWFELLTFENFGRFFSRNLYWYLGNAFFSPNALFYYIFNLTVIAGSSGLAFLLFRREHGRFLSAAAGLVYFTIPATILSYVWISNSQHLLGHFFVLLFVYLYQRLMKQGDSAWCAMAVLLAFLVGLSSNIFVSMAMSLVAWDLLTDASQRRKKMPYVVLVAGSLMALYFFARLSKGAAGSYSAKISIDVLIENLQFYWQSSWGAFLWVFFVLLGSVISIVRKNYFNAWLFLASVAFFMPFAFFVQQRYLQYGLLSHLFFCLGMLCLLGELLRSRAPVLLACLACAIVLAGFGVSLAKPIKYFLSHPWGVEARQQVLFLKDYDRRHPEVKNYCFREAGQVSPADAAAPAPAAWWFVGFGDAFTQFVNGGKGYALESAGTPCDAHFEFDGSELRQAR